MKKHLKTLYKIYNNGLVDDEYVYQRKNAFYNHIEWTAESKRLKDEVFPFEEEKSFKFAKNMLKNRNLCYDIYGDYKWII